MNVSEEIIERKNGKYVHKEMMCVRKSSEADREEIARLTAEWIAKNGEVPVVGIIKRDKNDAPIPQFTLNPVELIGTPPPKRTNTSIHRRAASGHQNLLITKRGIEVSICSTVYSVWPNTPDGKADAIADRDKRREIMCMGKADY